MGGQGGSFDLPRARGLPCEAWINLTAPIVKGGGGVPTRLMFSLMKSPLVAASGAFSGRGPG